MTARTRAWLRGFLRLGARADKDGIPASDIERQEDTVLRALDMLAERPGVVLADEVGMGKTYEALGVAAAMRHASPKARVVIVTPGPDLNRKWYDEFPRFKEMYDFDGDVRGVSGLREFVSAVRKHPVVVAPVTVFQSGRGSGAQAYLLSLYCHWKGLHGRTANAIMARFRDGGHARVDVKSARFLGEFDLAQVTPHLDRAFRRERRGDRARLDDLYETGGLRAFEDARAVKRALYEARFALTGRLIPMIDLLIVDEAHKLKNPGSLRTRAMREVFDGGFRKALFLTATPFQLDVRELREMFELFSMAKGAPKGLPEEVDALLAAVRDYQLRYDDFQRTWSSLDPAVAARFREAYDRDPEEAARIDDPTLAVVNRQIAALVELKAGAIEPGFRRWMIRSLREDKRTYRRAIPRDIPATGAGALPFLLYERFIAELFRRNRQTHKAAVEINMVSSYAAAHDGAILATGDGIPAEAEPYRALLRDVLGSAGFSAQDHPKVREALDDALAAAERGEKTLIFCSRIATLEQLKRELEGMWSARLLDRWRRVYPGAEAGDIFGVRGDGDRRHRGRHEQLQRRFQGAPDPLYLALREPYLRTLAPIAEWALGRLPEVVREANGLLGEVRVGKTAAEKLDYQVAKRCVEQAAARLWVAAGDGGSDRAAAFDNLLHPDFLRLGLDLAQDEYENDSVGEDQPRWGITEQTARRVLGGGGSLWEALAALLDQLDVALRVRVVEQLARYLTYQQVPFLPELLAEAAASGLSVESVESPALLAFLPRFWTTAAGRRWVETLRAFLQYFVQRDPCQRHEILNGPIRTAERGGIARHTRDGESRERLREAFNTPLFPMILIANEVMQEGLDLHRQCRRVMHHDLAWNPAQIEQRIGRVDRLGSLTHRLRERDPAVTLDVLYPVIQGTIDQRLYRTVKSREKWLEFLLGAAPRFSEYSFDDEEPPPLPDRLVAELAVHLGPR